MLTEMPRDRFFSGIFRFFGLFRLIFRPQSLLFLLHVLSIHMKEVEE